MSTVVEAFYDGAYGTQGAAAQRRYPNEEAVRFLARHFLAAPRPARAAMRLLDVGCGSGSNLWMLAHEGFDAHGLDLSAEGLKVCAEVLAGWGVSATLKHGSMTELPYADGFFDGVLDCFASNCLDDVQHARFRAEAARVLRPGGHFFSFHPSRRSDAYLDRAPARLVDESTLEGILRPSSPFHGNGYTFRFTTNALYAAELAAVGLEVTANERSGRTYAAQSEYFECVSIMARKPGP